VRGIEPPLQAWEARVLPLNYTRTGPARSAAVRGREITASPGKGPRQAQPSDSGRRIAEAAPSIPAFLGDTVT
jgi:hypothetical protein